MDKITILRNLFTKNIDFLKEKEINKTNDFYIKKILKNINKEKIIIISWIKSIWKTNIISDLIKRTNIWENYLYFNKDLDNENIIKNEYDLNNYLKLKSDIKYIILQNISKIEWVKNFISKIYKDNYKIIIIWNDIKIPKITQININKKIDFNKIENIKKYWFLWNSLHLDNTIFKKEYLWLLFNNILLKSIIELKWVKNIEMYKQTITFLSKVNSFKSIRELHRDFKKIENISLKTFMDYIDFSIQENIIKKIYLFDIKKNKEITSSVRFYFSDNWFRNYFNDYNLANKILTENLISIYLNYNNYNIYWWQNGLFIFSFIAKKENKTIYIHISDSKEKSEIKKEINKLLKIWDKNKKYLVVNDLEKLNLKKFVYENVEILDYKEIIKKDL